MIRLSKIFLMLLVLNGSQLFSQDIHFSQFYWSYLNLNPALTGQFNGDYRFNGNFKNQWSSISEPYKTFAFTAEAKSLLKKVKPLSIGINLFNDDAGIGGLKTTQIGISSAYSKKLNADSTFVIRAGLQFGLLNRSINFNNFSFDRQFNGSQFDASLSNGEDFSNNNFNNFYINSGIHLHYLIENRKTVSGGFAVFNINSANQSFLDEDIPLDRRINLYLQADYYVNEKIDLLPSVLYSIQGKFNELVFGTNIRYRLSQNDFLRRNVYGGVWYRNSDAIIITTGMDYNLWKVGINYDINVSNLNVASNNRGGIELSLTYLIRDFKPQIRRHKLCPKFM